MKYAKQYAGPVLESTDDMVGLSISAMRTAVEGGNLNPEKDIRAKIWLLTFDKAINDGKDRDTAIALASAESGLPVNQ